MPQHNNDFDLLIISEPHDQLAQEFFKYVRHAGRKPVKLTFPGAAKFFTISLNSNNSVVEPDIPIFLRPPLIQRTRKSFCNDFSNSEYLATIWSACHMTNSPCVNRPSLYGFSGRISTCTTITERRAGRPALVQEIYSDIVSQADSKRNLCLEDTKTFDTAILPNTPKGSGPYRMRSIHGEFYEFVVVVGKSAFRVSEVPLNGLNLEARSIRIIKNLQLTFGIVVWSISSDLVEANVSRIEPFPSLDQVHYVWSTTAQALEELLR